MKQRSQKLFVAFVTVLLLAQLLPAAMLGANAATSRGATAVSTLAGGVIPIAYVVKSTPAMPAGGTLTRTSEDVIGDADALGSTAIANAAQDYQFMYWTDSHGNIVGTSETFTPERNSSGEYDAETYTAHFVKRTRAIPITKIWKFRSNNSGHWFFNFTSSASPALPNNPKRTYYENKGGLVTTVPDVPVLDNNGANISLPDKIQVQESFDGSYKADYVVTYTRYYDEYGLLTSITMTNNAKAGFLATTYSVYASVLAGSGLAEPSYQLGGLGTDGIRYDAIITFYPDPGWQVSKVERILLDGTQPSGAPWDDGNPSEQAAAGATGLGTTDVTGSLNGNTYTFFPDANYSIRVTFIEKGYIVKYDTHGGLPSPIPDKTGVKWSQTNLLPGTPPTKEGYNFLGWFTTDDISTGTEALSTTTYADLAEGVDTVTSVTLHALWERKDTVFSIVINKEWERGIIGADEVYFTIKRDGVSLVPPEVPENPIKVSPIGNGHWTRTITGLPLYKYDDADISPASIYTYTVTEDDADSLGFVEWQ